jgi:hypothetical protein
MLRWPATDNQRSVHALYEYGAVTHGRDDTAGHETVACDDLVFAAAYSGGFVHAVADVAGRAWAPDCESLLAVR